MKKATRNVLLVSVITLIPFLAYSADGVSEGKVKKISANSDQLILQQLGASNPGNCGSTDQFISIIMSTGAIRIALFRRLRLIKFIIRRLLMNREKETSFML